MLNPKLSVLASTWAKHGDRWMLGGYHESKELDRVIETVSGIDGIDGIELIHPAHINRDNCREVRQRIEDAGLVISSIANSISGSREYYHGALTAPDKKIRKRAIDIVKTGLDIAAETGTPRTNLWLGREGYDYPFQVDYRETRNLLIEGLCRCANHRDDVRICIEYKLREPKAHLYAGSASATLVLIHEAAAENLGVLLDTGHALYAYENLGETICLLDRMNKLFHVHFNDNHRIEDDDMVAGSVHLFEFVEAIYWLSEIGYSDWISFDPHPLGEDETRSVEENVRFFRGALSLLDDMGYESIRSMLASRRAMDVYRELQKRLFSV